MRDEPPEALERRAASLRAELSAAVETHGRVIYASSLGAKPWS